MSDPMTIIAVAGGAEVSRENVWDLIKDFLLIDTSQEKEFRFYLVADGDYIGDAVVHTAAFLADLGESYTAIKGAVATPKAKQLARRADDVIETESGTEGEKLIEILAEAKESGNEAYLFLAWGDGEESPDDVTADLLELAVDADIPVKDLTQGLDDLAFDDAEDEAETEEEEPPAEEEKPARKPKELKETERELTDEAQSTEPGLIEGHQPEIPDLVTTLAFVAQKLDFEDRANAANQMQPHYYRPLTRAVRHHLQKLMADSGPTVKASVTMPEAAESASEPISEPAGEKPRARRGKARDVDSDVVKVYVHEDNRTLRLVPGRGRPKKGEETKEMTRLEYKKLLDSGEYTPF